MIAAAMSTKKTVWFIVLSISTLTLGLTDFSCKSTTPLKGSDVTCKCITPNNIEWKLNNVVWSTCVTAGICSPKPTGYEFTTTNTSNFEKEYSLTVQGYDYTSCKIYSCKDSTTAEEENITLSIAAFDSTSPSVFVEPGNNQDGNIEITTECLFKESDITVEWFYIKKNSVIEVPYTPGAHFQTSTNCTDSCNGETAVRLNIGFAHTENGAQTVNFGLRVYHKENTTNVLKIQTSSEYNITAPTVEIYNCPGLGNSTAVDSEGKCVCAWIGISFGILLVVLFLIGICCGCILICECCYERIMEDESCNDCASHNCCKCKCFDSTPCRVCCNIKRLPSCYQVLWATIIGIPVAFGIWLVWSTSEEGKSDKDDTSRNVESTRSSPEKAKSKLLNEKKQSSASGKTDGGNKGQHVSDTQPHPNDKSQKVHQEKEGRRLPSPPPGAILNLREGSGSIVSGRDVEMQDTDNSFKRSQLPNIHDKKGRGLSANFTDEHHPLANIDIPAKKAGALDSIPDSAREEVKKKKKRSNKSTKAEDDDQND